MPRTKSAPSVVADALEGISTSLDAAFLSSENPMTENVADGLHAIARAIDRLAEAITDLVGAVTDKGRAHP